MDLFHFEWNTVPFRLIAFVIAFSLHEWAHAFIAWKLGDSTAKDEGRLTLNPIPHIDPFGLILILFGPFGWAKPVPINPLHFRGNKRLGIVYVSAAGPLINLVLSIISYTIFILMGYYGVTQGMGEKAVFAIEHTMQYLVTINAALFMFNLLPVPPLDGYKILRFLSPRSWDGVFYKFEIYGPWILLLLIFIPGIRSIIFDVPFMMVIMGVQGIAQSIATLFI
ncbi:zinc metalloprotease [Brevibacillus reuszeri]|uniref:Peptidase M50 n=1 Tax=Brevibacillus reuszeri TaxID=54915 RepID=A0A0K9YR64_9BACL|nr:site-2 protease family protein [Brevibacillus reuszeri]KNB71132.1 peptidase M50 [Brevibacillus reuszeri]MED1857561.1 site-2 protease family protein [Brevibacillus reuszeri]GED66606.1 zinc metalloprotease [Brevibacillus reuszeri]